MPANTLVQRRRSKGRHGKDRAIIQRRRIPERIPTYSFAVAGARGRKGGLKDSGDKKF